MTAARPLFVWIAAALLAGGFVKKTASAAEPEGAASLSESARANAFFEEVFMENVRRSPMFQTRLGMKTDYGKWDDMSEARAKEDHELVKRSLSKLETTIDYARLDEQTRISYDLFVAIAERDIANFAYRHHDYPVNQMFGLQSTLPAFLINYHRIDTRSDADAYIERLLGVEPLFRQLIENLEIRKNKGVIAPKFVFAHVLSDCRNVLRGRPFDDSAEDGTILADFRAKVRALDVSDDDKAALLARATDALLTSVRPAYEALIEYVTGLEDLATTDDGVWKLPDGEAYYALRLRNMTTTTLSADEIHALGLQEVARIHGEMREIMRSVGFEGSIQTFFKYLREDGRFYYEESEAGRQAYLERAAEIIGTMKGRLDELFLSNPRSDIVVKRVEAFREQSAGKAFYERPSPDGKRPGIYYANLYRMSDMPIYQMEALAYHEGIPGHHMQFATIIELDGLPKFRKYARYTAHTEGWGLYSEYIPKEIGFYEDPYSDFGRLAMELWRACRLVVDTGIHSKRWTRRQAIDYLVENTPNPWGDALKAIERYIVIPGQATAYKVGMLKIMELRERSQSMLGERFDIREFHDVILKNGPVPLTMLEKLVMEWVAAKGS